MSDNILENTLKYIPTHKMIICMPCQIGVSGGSQSIHKHLRENHSGLPKEARSALAQRFTRFADALSQSERDKIRAAIAGGAITELPCLPGFACTVPGCNYAVGHKSTFKNHVLHDHKQDGSHVIEPRECRVQCPFKGPVIFFEVGKPDQGEGGDGVRPPAVLPTIDSNQTCRPTDSAGPLEAIKNTMESYLHEQRAALHKMAPPNLHQVTQWERQTGFAAHNQNRDLRPLRKLCEVVFPGDQPYFDMIPTAVEAVFERLHETIADHPREVLQHWRAFTPNTEPGSKHFQKLEAASCAAYISIAQQLVCYLVRASTDGTDDRLRLQPTQRRCIDRIRTLVRDSAPEDEEQTRTWLQATVTELLRDIFSQMLPGSPFESPLIHFLSILAFNPITSVWHDAKYFRPVFSHLRFWHRLVHLDFFDRIRAECPPSGINGAQIHAIREESNINEAALAYLKIYTHHGTNTWFSWLTPIARYVSGEGINDYAAPLITWDLRRTRLIIEGHSLAMADVVAMARDLLSECTQGCLRLIFRDRPFLEECSPILFSDNFLWRNLGESFVDLNPHKLHRTWLVTLQRCSQEPTGVALYNEVTLREKEPSGEPRSVCAG